MFLSVATTYTFNKRRNRCLCDEDLFPNCDCADYEDDEKYLPPNKRHKDFILACSERPDTPPLIRDVSVQRKNDFLVNYPLIVHPEYKLYCGDVTMAREIHGGIRDYEEESNVMIIIRRALLQEKDWYKENRQRVERDARGRPHTYYDMKGEEEELLDVCLELAHDYYACGYAKLKEDYDSGNYYTNGRLVNGKCCKTGPGCEEFVVGEVFDCVSPDRDIECIIDKFVKAIAIVEKWETEENFLEAWESLVFKNAGERSYDRFVYVGWHNTTYLGWNTPEYIRRDILKSEARKKQVFQQFNRMFLSKFWGIAWRNVKALLLMDCIKRYAIDFVRDSDGTEPFDFGFEYD